MKLSLVRPALTFKLIVAGGLLMGTLLVGLAAHSQVSNPVDPWSGSVQCQLDIDQPGYTRHDVQTWTITGEPPKAAGGTGVLMYPATWTYVGQGSLQRSDGSRTTVAQWQVNIVPGEAPLSFSIRDGVLVIKRASGQQKRYQGYTGQRQTAINGMPQPPTPLTPYTIWEWPLPYIEAVPGPNVSGTVTLQTEPVSGEIQQPGPPPVATCAYQFSKNASGLQKTRTASSAATAGVSNFSALQTAGAANGMKQVAMQPPPPSSSPGPSGVAVVNPARPTTAGSPGMIDKAPSRTISAVKPTGAPPEGFSVTAPSPAVALVQWTPAVAPGGNSCDGFGSCSCGASASYHLYRSEESGAPVELPIGPVQCSPVQYKDDGVDPRFTYSYRLVAEYNDGTWGEATATVRSPALANPTGFRATVVPPDGVQLQWDAMPGALRYLVSGATLPVTGQEVTQTSLSISPFRGAGSWQIAAIYPGNFADYANMPVARTTSKAIPPHSPGYLSKSAGSGSAAEATAHYAQFCNWTADSPPCGDLVSYLQSWGVAASDISNAATSVRYNNVTDLGSPRETRCYRTLPTQVDNYTESFPWGTYQRTRSRKFFGSNVVICYASTATNVSLIVMNGQGARFGIVQATADQSYYGAGSGLSPSSLFDSEGPKFAPHVCLSCHGGQYDPTTNLVQGASLLPIDPSLVQVVGDPVTSQENIRQINSLVRQFYSSSAVAAYIDGLYGGFQGTHHKVDDTGAQAIADFVPSGWATQKSFYLDFVKKDCAMCHLTGPSNLNFFSAGNFLSNKALVYTAVCKAHSMPHAETAFVNFWTRQSGAASGPGWFATVLGYADCQ